jgi:dihydroneopterin aldolase
VDQRGAERPEPRHGVKIFVSGLEFVGYHGVTEQEREDGHRFLLDLNAEVRQSASSTDRIEDTVDYGELGEFAVELCNRESDHTLEYACERIGLGLLEKFKSIEEVEVKISKIHPVLHHQIGAVGVLKRFSRQE